MTIDTKFHFLLLIILYCVTCSAFKSGFGHSLHRCNKLNVNKLDGIDIDGDLYRWEIVCL